MLLLQVFVRYDTQNGTQIWVGLDFMEPGESWNFTDEHTVHIDVTLVDTNEVCEYNFNKLQNLIWFCHIFQFS